MGKKAQEQAPKPPAPASYEVAPGCSVCCGKRRLGPGDKLDPGELSAKQLEDLKAAGVLKAGK